MNNNALYIPSESEPYEIQALLQLAESYTQKKEWQAVRLILTRAAATSAQAELALAELWLNAPLEQPVMERLLNAERLLLHLDASHNSSKVCILLSNLYQRVGKAYAALGYRLRSERYDPHYSRDELINYCKRAIRSLPVTTDNQLYGCYILGTELSVFSESQELIHFACFCLKNVADSSDGGSYVGLAAFQLAEITEDPAYYKVAEKHGYPLLLKKDNRN